jgi:hypothetical protein
MLFERVATIRGAWQAVFEVEPPHPDRLNYWCQRYSDTAIEHALARAVKKLQKGDVRKLSGDIERYVSGVLRHEAEKSNPSAGCHAA